MSIFSLGFSQNKTTRSTKDKNNSPVVTTKTQYNNLSTQAKYNIATTKQHKQLLQKLKNVNFGISFHKKINFDICFIPKSIFSIYKSYIAN